MHAQHKALTWIGWILTVLISGMLIMSATMKFMSPPDIEKHFTETFGYPSRLILILGAVELICVLFFLLPQTAILGAILLTGYLGGAIATHVRVEDNFAGAAVGGVLVWLAVFLREPRLRAILPWRSTTSSSDTPG